MSNANIANGCLASPVVVESGWSSRELLEEFIAKQCKPIRDKKEQVTRFVIAASDRKQAESIARLLGAAP